MIVIIGGGAAGLYCAAHIKNDQVLLLEKNTRLGLKLLVSGNGQCNLTHAGDWADFPMHYGGRDKFVKSAIRAHDNKAVMAFFEAQTLPVVVREDGKVFPESMRSKDVLEAVKRQIRLNGNVSIEMGQPVTGVGVEEDGFIIETPHNKVHADVIVLASGGFTYPQLGTTGDGYRFAAELGHTVIASRPALASVHLDDKKLKILQGLVIHKMDFECVKPQGQRLAFEGDVLFTHFGLSGPGILDNSRDLLPGDQLLLNFTGMKKQVLETSILKEIEKNGRNPVSYLLNQLGLADRVKNLILTTLDLDPSQKISVLSKNQRKSMIEVLCAYPVEIKKLSDIKEAMATAGGLSTEEFSSKTMMSKVIPGFYAIGEVLDVDGDTGGYNLQWAFSSAKAAASSIEKKMREKQDAK